MKRSGIIIIPVHARNGKPEPGDNVKREGMESKTNTGWINRMTGERSCYEKARRPAPSTQLVSGAASLSDGGI